MKKSFVLYIDQYEPIKGLTDEQKGQLLDAMFKHNSDVAFTICDPIVKMAFSFFKETFKRDRDKYLKRCEKNRENVRMRWNLKDTNVYERIRTDTKHTDSGSDSGSDTIVINNIQVEFDAFWHAYDKKKDRAKCVRKWKSLKDSEIKAIFEKVHLYVQSTPDPQYRKNPLTWLNGKCWQDDVTRPLNAAEKRLINNMNNTRGFLDE